MRTHGGRPDPGIPHAAWPVWRATLPDDLGREIRAARRARGMSLRTAAQRIGIGASYLSEIERGRKAPRTAVAEQLIAVLALDHATAAELREHVAPPSPWPSKPAAATAQAAAPAAPAAPRSASSPRTTPPRTWAGERLREERQLADVTLTELADASGVPRGTIGGIERGDRTDERTLRRIAQGLAAIVGMGDGAALGEQLVVMAGEKIAPDPFVPAEQAERRRRAAEQRERDRERMADPQLARARREVRRLTESARALRRDIRAAEAAGDADQIHDALRRFREREGRP